MEKSYKFRLYPKPEQEKQIQKTFGCCRFVYNYFLARREEKYKAGEGIWGYFDCCRELTELKQQEEYSWLYEADASALQVELKNLDFAFKSFFRRVKLGDVAPGFPRFKSKRSNVGSYTCRRNNAKDNIRIEDDTVKIPKIGFIKCRISRPVEGRILSATVSMTSCGKYFVTLCCTEIEFRQLPETEKMIGLHFGIKDLAVTSDGQRFKNQRYLAKSQKKISRLQRQMSRKPKDSKNREKARIKLALAHEKVVNQRLDAMHKLTTRLVKENGVIAAESFKVQQMQKNGRFGKELSDVSWGNFIKQLDYKCKFYGREFIQTQNFYPSVKICNMCGVQHDDTIPPHMTEWVCSNCGTTLNRNLNAAVNVLNEGIKLLN